MRLATPLAFGLLLGSISAGGCVIVIKEGHHGHGEGGYEGGYNEGWEDTGWDTDVEEVETTLLLTPDTVATGETKILSLTADPVLDYHTISDVQFYGGATVCTFEARDTELLLTVSVPTGTPTGVEDMVVLLNDGTTISAPGALNVVMTGDDTDPNGGANGGSDTNSDPSTGSGGCGA